MCHSRDLTDGQWNTLSPLVPKPKTRSDGRGRPWKSRRSVINGILWVSTTAEALKNIDRFVTAKASLKRPLKTASLHPNMAFSRECPRGVASDSQAALDVREVQESCLISCITVSLRLSSSSTQEVYCHSLVLLSIHTNRFRESSPDPKVRPRLPQYLGVSLLTVSGFLA